MTVQLRPLVPPEEIKPHEIQYWDRMDDRSWAQGVEVWRSPNKSLMAWLRDGEIVALWDRHTGKVHRFSGEAVREAASRVELDRARETLRKET